MEPTKLWTAGVVGGRYFNDWDFMVEQLKLWQTQHGQITKIVSGGAAGADKLAERYSREYLRQKPVVFPAEWTKYGKRAGAIRNAKIVEASQVIIAFPDPKSKGTWITVEMAQKKNLPTYVYRKSIQDSNCN